MPEPKNPARIAGPLLVFLASGGTLERAVTNLPAFKLQLEAAFEWMRSNMKCSPAEVENLANRLREITHKKDSAMRRKDFHVAMIARSEECALFKSVGLSAPTGETWSTIMYEGVEEQIQRLSSLLSEMYSGTYEPGSGG